MSAELLHLRDLASLQPHLFYVVAMQTPSYRELLLPLSALHGLTAGLVLSNRPRNRAPGLANVAA